MWLKEEINKSGNAFSRRIIAGYNGLPGVRELSGVKYFMNISDTPSRGPLAIMK